MTNSPDGKEIRYKTAKELEELFVQLGFGKILEGCKISQRWYHLETMKTPPDTKRFRPDR